MTLLDCDLSPNTIITVLKVRVIKNSFWLIFIFSSLWRGFPFFKNYFIYFLNLIFIYLFPAGLHWYPKSAGVPHFCWMEVGVQALPQASEDTTLPERTRLPCCCCRCILYLHCGEKCLIPTG